MTNNQTQIISEDLAIVSRLKSRQEYVRNLKLAVPSKALMQLSSTDTTLVEQDEAAYVMLGSTVSFVGGVPKLLQSDVLNSCMLATLAANNKFDPELETEAWYRFYQEVLQNVGWVIQSFNFVHYKQSGKSIKLDKSALAIMQAIASGNELKVLEATLTALDESNPDSKQATLFETNGSSGAAGNFQLTTASADPSGNVQMSLGASHFKSKEHRRKFLFWTYKTESINVYFGAQSIVLNEQIYSIVRESVVEKLGENALKFVANLDIGF